MTAASRVARLPESGREQAPEDAASIHRKGRNQVEDHHPDVHREETPEESSAWRPRAEREYGIETVARRAGQDGQRDHHVHERPGDRHHEFLPRLLGIRSSAATPPMAAA